jgi:hypothetical protein
MQEMKRSATNALFAIRNLATLFLAHSKDTDTLRTIIDYTNDRSRWEKAHGLFDQIRSKAGKATRDGDSALEAQYCFEEVCVKTIYNLGRYSAPFDPDSPYWIIPNAIAAGDQIGLSPLDILEQIAPQCEPQQIQKEA